MNATVRKSGKLASRFTCVTMIEINFHLDNMTDMICHRIMCNQFCLIKLLLYLRTSLAKNANLERENYFIGLFLLQNSRLYH